MGPQAVSHLNFFCILLRHARNVYASEHSLRHGCVELIMASGIKSQHNSSAMSDDQWTGNVISA